MQSWNYPIHNGTHETLIWSMEDNVVFLDWKVFDYNKFLNVFLQ